MSLLASQCNDSASKNLIIALCQFCQITNLDILQEFDNMYVRYESKPKVKIKKKISRC